MADDPVFLRCLIALLNFPAFDVFKSYDAVSLHIPRRLLARELRNVPHDRLDEFPLSPYELDDFVMCYVCRVLRV